MKNTTKTLNTLGLMFGTVQVRASSSDFNVRVRFTDLRGRSREGLVQHDGTLSLRTLASTPARFDRR